MTDFAFSPELQESIDFLLSMNGKMAVKPEGANEEWWDQYKAAKEETDKLKNNEMGKQGVFNARGPKRRKDN